MYENPGGGAKLEINSFWNF